jgi:hypothetical protein
MASELEDLAILSRSSGADGKVIDIRPDTELAVYRFGLGDFAFGPGDRLRRAGLYLTALNWAAFIDRSHRFSDRGRCRRRSLLGGWTCECSARVATNISMAEAFEEAGGTSRTVGPFDGYDQAVRGIRAAVSTGTRPGSSRRS